ncbi:unnamed protein product [Cercopithifilaria johnstoni]|uniref:Uncharacterized protein n=1 Tax=Cercopithifilaria johnstoni TaxID=2874296 RepID=A0A8J2LTH1_9BILA|nr:unnamed protein product [Cercopithifilaria johnstoni]
MHQKSIYLDTGKDTDIQVEPEAADQVKVEEDMNRDLIKLVERTQNSDKSLINKRKVFMKTKSEAANDKKNEKKHKKEKLHSNGKNDHQILIQKTIIPEMGQHETQSTQADDFKDSKIIDQIHSGEQCRKRKSNIDKRYKDNNSEEAREGVAKSQSLEEEPSTLEGVASIARDDAPSAVSQLRHGTGSVKISLIQKRRALNKTNPTKRRFVKKS